MKKIGIILFTLLVCFVGVYANDTVVLTEKGSIIDVDVDASEIDTEVESIQHVKLKVTTGKYKGKEFFVENHISGAYIYDIPVSKGDKVLLHIEEYENGEMVVYIADYVRDSQILVLLFLFVLTILYVGRVKGIKTIVTLSFTVLMVWKVHLPLLLKGVNPILVTIVVSVFITIVTIYFISGRSKKTIAATLGTLLGVIIAGLLALYVGAKVKLTGLSNEEAAMLMYIPQGNIFNFRDLLFSGILLGALGAVMDVSMSIASAVDELNKVNKNLSWKKLFTSGMNVGRDIMGTMSNTLILAYTGSSIPLLLLFMAYDAPLMKMINLDIIATEIIRSLAGSIGIVLTIPITAAISVLLLKDTNTELDQKAKAEVFD